MNSNKMRCHFAALKVLLCAFLFAFSFSANAQSAERVALVIGNSAYLNSPLVNPRHDAQAMSDLLKKAGFSVDVQLDTDLPRLQGALRKFGTAIRNPKVKFGLFYYAGHGLQQDWRNYLVPVEANIANASEIAKKTVDVSQLLGYMDQAQGRSFLVILDACRDNPFADKYKSTAKGLSQFDAPVGSLLAYATAPGNVALDGGGADNSNNGLYTSFLLREFAVPGARIEDAFKRVRLNVRLASKGQQIPWESTSLEEDLYLFPGAKQSLTEAEKETLLEKEMALWQSVKATSDPEILARFIRQFPSGNASELAAARMNRILVARFDLESKERKAKEEAAVAAAALELANKEEAARLKIAQSERLRLEAQKQEQERQRVAQLEAEREADKRREAEKLAREAAAKAREAAEKSRLAELEVLRVARLKQETAQKAAQQEAFLQAEQARLAQSKVVVAQAELRRFEAQIASRSAQESARAKEVELQNKNLAVRAAEERQELARLAQEKQLLEQQKIAQSQSVSFANLAATPFSKGSSQHERRFAEGEEHRFLVVDLTTQAQRTAVRRVTKVEPEIDRVTFNDGAYVSDQMGNALVNQFGSNNTVRQFYPVDLYVGKRWTTQFRQTRQSGNSIRFEYQLKVTARETITVPAGTFDAFKIEARGVNRDQRVEIERNIWVAPGINADILQTYRVVDRFGTVEANQREELVAYTPGRGK
jgi:uncharacterized caspase-like protein